MLQKVRIKRIVVFWLVLFITIGVITGCAQNSEQTGEDPAETELNDGHDSDHEHEDDGRIPNNGALIRIVSPEDEASYASGEDIVIEVEIENFEINVDGSHWHVYVDGVSFGMVVGNTTSQVLRNLEPGEHVVTAHLAGGDHVELEDPGMVTITVTE